VGKQKSHLYDIILLYIANIKEKKEVSQMAVIIIIADENGNQLEKINAQIKSENWEEECYSQGIPTRHPYAST
jgi:predicted DsbA family dithiol-disulfide isomerase